MFHIHLMSYSFSSLLGQKNQQSQLKGGKVYCDLQFLEDLVHSWWLQGRKSMVEKSDQGKRFVS